MFLIVKRVKMCSSLKTECFLLGEVIHLNNRRGVHAINPFKWTLVKILSYLLEQTTIYNVLESHLMEIYTAFELFK